MDLMDILRNDKYAVKAFRICPFNVLARGNATVLHPDGEGYGMRIGILDKAKNIVIDIDMQCAYRFIPTNSSGLIRNPYITPGYRYAYMPVDLSYREASEYEHVIKKIVKKIEKNYIFPEGNEMYTNEEYLNMLDKITLKRELSRIDEPKRKIKKRFFNVK